MKTQKTNKWVQRIWLIASVLVMFLYIAAYTIMSEYTGGELTDNATWGMYAGWVAIAGFPVIAFLILAAWFTKGGKKAVPIICALVCVFMAGMSYFAYSFSSYGS